MATTTLSQATKLEADEVRTLAQAAGLSLSDSSIEDFRVLLGSFEDHAQAILSQDDILPLPDPTPYIRTNIHIPEDNEKGGWATRCIVKSTAPTSSLLAGRTVAVKDNTAVAGVRCLNGLAPVHGEWVPPYDATIVTRVMDAGGIIVGKAACENACMEGISNTSYTGPVHNPFADGYTAGGSSSGCGRLVAIGSVDMALGADQGGSCRIPAAFCGIVGFKPTFGLVPYTGILGLQSTIDHAGPITRTVRENALLLEAIAGPDGLDDRQPPLMPPTDFSNALDQFLVEHPEMTLRGFKIGVLKEGFTSEHLDPNIAEACRAAISVLKDLGAEIVDMSVPTHQQTFVAWMCALPLRGAREGLLGDTTGRKQLELTERGPSLAPAMGTAPTFLSQEVFDSFAAGAQNLYMRHLYVQQKHGAMLHAKSMNILRQAARDYDDVLSSVDVLVMPTVPMPARPFPKTKGGPLQGLSDAAGMLDNTAQFNATGHPALSIPVGFVPAKDDAGVKLPVGLQIVAKRWDDLTCYKVGSAWEMKMDWKTLEFGVQPQT